MKKRKSQSANNKRVKANNKEKNQRKKVKRPK
jgi:hypothetical protein